MVKIIKKNISCSEALDLPMPAQQEMPVVLVVACALIDRDGRVLLAQRPKGKLMEGLWEFPGGKVKIGETLEYALVRELEEELGIETRPCALSPAAFASHSYEDFHLIMPLFICRIWKGIPIPNEKQALKWVYPKEIFNYPMPQADIPLVDQLLHLL